MYMDDVDRGTGRTSRQMLEAPELSVFIWCNDQLHYPTRLARRLGRFDLLILGLNTLGTNHHRLYGIQRPIIVDHAVEWTPLMEHARRLIDRQQLQAA